jgi:NAD(P)-dependent dehydrogenase (short-subunit alcohol dehydrogenase family)
MSKNILLIGGSTGIGYETAKRLHNDYNVIVASRQEGNLNELNVTHHKFDVMEDDIAELDLPDVLHGLLYLPGTINLKPFKMIRPNIFEDDMKINFFKLVETTQGVLKKLKEADQASIVYISTVAVQTGMPFHTSVAAAKGAIEGFARSLAAEYAPNFRVNIIAPSLTNTPLANKLLGNDKKKEKMDARHPLKRVAEAADIAEMTTYLLTDKSSWMTGQVIGLDGGMSSLNIS